MEKEKFDVLATSSSKAFIIKHENVEEIKNQNRNVQSNDQILEMANHFKNNNLINNEDILKKTKILKIKWYYLKSEICIVKRFLMKW